MDPWTGHPWWGGVSYDFFGSMERLGAGLIRTWGLGGCFIAHPVIVHLWSELFRGSRAGLSILRSGLLLFFGGKGLFVIRPGNWWRKGEAKFQARKEGQDGGQSKTGKGQYR